MATTLRVLSALAAVLLAHSPAAAQLSMAPPPHATLDDLVTEYRRLGLPILPLTAEFVRIDWFKDRDDDDRIIPTETPYLLAFKLPARQPGSPPRYWVGVGFGEWDHVDPGLVEYPPATRDALNRVSSLGSGEVLCFAVQCKIRGWNELAAALHARAREEIARDAVVRKENAGEEAEGIIERSSVDELRGAAWDYWSGRLHKQGTDRHEILQRLKGLYEADMSFLNEYSVVLLYRLELTVAPRKSKPGSVEALIDDLTEYWIEFGFDASDSPGKESREAYWKLAELGFDAVPALIEHLKDDRLTRATSMGFNIRSAHDLTVGHLCSQLLFDLSARTIGGGYWALRGDRLDPEKAREWFAAAQKVGEEKWLLAHALPKDGGGAITNQRGRPEGLIVHVIAAKYPARLAEVYRGALRQPASPFNGDYIEQILASKLTREQKIALLEEGARHEDSQHRAYALDGIAALDLPRFRKHVLARLKQAQGEIETGKPVHNGGYLLGLAERANDRACWDVLFALAGKVSVESRFDMIWSLGRISPFVTNDPIRRERLRFLLQALDDRSPRRFELSEEEIEIRDHAAQQLAGVLRFPVKREGIEGAIHDVKSGGLSRFVLREFVWQVATRELAVGK